LPNDKHAPKELKVTDKRIFTADGDIRDEFKKATAEGNREAAPASAGAEPARNDVDATPDANFADAKTAEKPLPAAASEERRQRNEPPPQGEERRRTMADKATNPVTPFTNFIEPLIAQAYMSLGMLRNPYQPQAKLDPGAARQMIEILTLLREKTQGNLTADEEDFLETHLGELKLAYVQRTKSI
jgi:hypothetical protein